jgi:hypothetical protein
MILTFMWIRYIALLGLFSAYPSTTHIHMECSVKSRYTRTSLARRLPSRFNRLLISHFQQYFGYIVAVSFIRVGNRSAWRKPPTCRNTLTNVITCMNNCRWFLCYGKWWSTIRRGHRGRDRIVVGIENHLPAAIDW